MILQENWNDNIKILYSDTVAWTTYDKRSPLKTVKSVKQHKRYKDLIVPPIHPSHYPSPSYIAPFLYLI